MLARRAGVQLKQRHKQTGESSNKNQFFEANELASKYFHLALSKSLPAKDYLLKDRKLKPETIKKYRLGYAPDSWEGLCTYLQNKGFSRADIIQSGLAAQGRKAKDSAYDIFRGRVMFPVFDMQNRVIGFSARVLDPNANAAKYINTPQTGIYNKSFAIYGLAQAKEAIRHTDQVIIVEGNMDVLALSNAGFENVVACSGTALTELQLKQLSRLTKNIYLSFDMDSAGITAAQRAIEIALPMDIRLHIVTFQDAKDPDELITKDKKLWEEAVEAAQYAPDYLLEFAKAKYNVKTAVGKKDYVRFLLPLLRAITDEVEAQHYTKKVAQAVESSEESIQKLLKSPVQQKVSTDQNTAPAQPDSGKRRLSRLEKLEQELLELLLANPTCCPALDDINIDHVSEVHRPIFTALKKSSDLSLEDISKGLPKQSDYVRILSLRGEQHYSDLSEHDRRLEAFTQVQRINRLQKELNKRQLAKQLAEAEAAGKTNQAKALLRKYQELLNEE
jgi:DNA primase